MKVICSACGADLGTKPSPAAGGYDVSHGLCDSCCHHFLAEIGMPLGDYIEGIPAPVVTWGDDGVIGTANQHARDLLGKTLPDLQGYKGGDVFECKYARRPEGCGQTIHCSGCTIRKTATDTFRTGQPHQRVPAFLERVRGT